VGGDLRSEIARRGVAGVAVSLMRPAVGCGPAGLRATALGARRRGEARAASLDAACVHAV